MICVISKINVKYNREAERHGQNSTEAEEIKTKRLTINKRYIH
jgi:hypothetical protein